MPVQLRPYQIDMENRCRQAFGSGYKSPLVVMPTGSGKTVLFSSMADSAARRNRRIMILVHRIELVDQIVESLKLFEQNPNIIASDYPRSDRIGSSITVASIQTLIRRLTDYVPPDLLIIDEAHHSPSETYKRIFDHYATSKKLGVTATPIRLDGRGLGNIFDHMIVGPSVSSLMAGGYLCRARTFSPPTVDTSGLHIRGGDFVTAEAEALIDKPSITGDAIDHHQRQGNGAPALAFCTSVRHAHHVAEDFRTRGIQAAALDGGTAKDIRRMVVKDFREGKLRVLVSCDLFSEGFDVPGVHVGLLLRPTASEALHRQQIGRTLRPAPGKDAAIILDHVNNTRKFGLPDEAKEWTLSADKVHKKKNENQEGPVKVCTSCFAASSARATKCSNCGEPFPRQERQIDKKKGELVEITPEQMRQRRERQEQGRNRTLQELEDFARRKGYSPQWATHVMEARQRKKGPRLL